MPKVCYVPKDFTVAHEAIITQWRTPQPQRTGGIAEPASVHGIAAGITSVAGKLTANGGNND